MTSLLRADETDVGAARDVWRREHRVLTRITHAARERRKAVLLSPAGRSVHALRAIERLKRTGPAALQRIGSRARLVRLRDAETGRADLEHGHVGADDRAAMRLR